MRRNRVSQVNDDNTVFAFDIAKIGQATSGRRNINSLLPMRRPTVHSSKSVKPRSSKKRLT